MDCGGVTGRHGIGEAGDLRDRRGDAFAVLDLASALDLAGVGHDPALRDCVGEHHAEEPVGLGDAGAAGGMFSSSRDLVKLGHSILNNAQLSSASTRRWLKPWGHTAVWQQDLGLAWEILRWPVHGRIVDVYTKQGDLGMLTNS